MLTGQLAGAAAARGAPAASYLRDCRRLLRRSFLVSSAFRAIIASGHAGLLASLVPWAISLSRHPALRVRNLHGHCHILHVSILVAPPLPLFAHATFEL